MKKCVVSLIVLFLGLATGFRFSAVTNIPAASAESLASQNSGTAGAAASDTLLGPTISPDRPSLWFPASAQPPSTDADYDGLTDDVEENGWENSAGFFITNPLDPDSDDDGLTDGQEKLFDTDPLDDTSPGIYVEYDKDLKTSKYFPWDRHGSKFIALSSAVVRRGATFYVGGPADATIEVSKSSSSLKSLALQRDFCAGRWSITVPTNGTVGKYAVTLQKGAWSKSLNLYVIFELPPNMSEADIAAFVYSDDPDNVRDEYSIFYLMGEKDWSSNSDYHWSRGSGYAFQTDQYQAYVFEDHVINAINGYTDREKAVIALGKHVDEILRFEPMSLKYNMWRALHAYNKLAQCSTHSNVLTGFARAAGIPARPVGMDYDQSWGGGHNVLFDYSTEVWVLSNDWKVMRAYAKDEPPDQPIDGGIKYPKSRRQWIYPESQGDTIVAAKSNWDMEHMNTYWGQDTQWDYNVSNYDKRRIVRWDWVDTLAKPYWGWSREPTDVGDPPQYPVRVTGTQSAEGMAQSSLVQFGQVVADYGVDLDGNGRFDQLVVEVEVNATQPGYYSIGGLIDSDKFTSYAKIEAIASAASYTYLAAGTQTVSLVFDGRSISLARVDGPYEVRGLWISNLDLSSDPIDLAINTLERKDPGYMTAAYRVDDFETLGATLTDQYSERGEDSDHDGRYESLTIDVGLAISTPGTYTVMGELYDRQGRFLSQATWAGSGSPASLRFEEIGGAPGPYTLRNLYLLNANEEIIDSRDQAYTTQQVVDAEGKTHIIDKSDLGGVEAQGILPDTYSDSGVDLNGDGLYDLLAISVRVEVDEPGRYRLEGWLEGEDGSLVSWARSDATDLAAGTQRLTLAFSGPAIRAHNTDGPFTLMALKLLRGDAYEIVDEVDVAYTTSVYGSTDGEGTGIFEDDMESSSSGWTPDSPWTRTRLSSRSPTHSWTDSPGEDYSNNANVSLTTVSIDVPELTAPEVRFQGCYALKANDYGRVEISVNGGAWTRLLTYTDGAQRWNSERAKLDSNAVVTSLKARFRLSSNGSGTADGWYIDDVIITGDPDADADGILTADEYYAGDTPLCTPNNPTSPPKMDTDNDGILNCRDNDADGDGIPNYLDNDSDADGTSDRVESGCAAPGVGCPGTPVDTDGDGVPDWLDEDSDGDGVLDGVTNLYLPLIFKGGS